MAPPTAPEPVPTRVPLPLYAVPVVTVALVSLVVRVLLPHPAGATTSADSAITPTILPIVMSSLLREWLRTSLPRKGKAHATRDPRDRAKNPAHPGGRAPSAARAREFLPVPIVPPAAEERTTSGSGGREARWPARG